MIEIFIDKAKATPEEISALESAKGYQQLVSEIVTKGRQLGITLTIVERVPSGAAHWMHNITEGVLQVVATPVPRGRSAFHS
jgi:hypothetical protein